MYVLNVPDELSWGELPDACTWWIIMTTITWCIYFYLRYLPERAQVKPSDHMTVTQVNIIRWLSQVKPSGYTPGVRLLPIEKNFEGRRLKRYECEHCGPSFASCYSIRSHMNDSVFEGLFGAHERANTPLGMNACCQLKKFWGTQFDALRMWALWGIVC